MCRILIHQFLLIWLIKVESKPTFERFGLWSRVNWGFMVIKRLKGWKVPARNYYRHVLNCHSTTTLYTHLLRTFHQGQATVNLLAARGRENSTRYQLTFENEKATREEQIRRNSEILSSRLCLSVKARVTCYLYDFCVWAPSWRHKTRSNSVLCLSPHMLGYADYQARKM